MTLFCGSWNASADDGIFQNLAATSQGPFLGAKHLSFNSLIKNHACRLFMLADLKPIPNLSTFTIFASIPIHTIIESTTQTALTTPVNPWRFAYTTAKSLYSHNIEDTRLPCLLCLDSTRGKLRSCQTQLNQSAIPCTATGVIISGRGKGKALNALRAEAHRQKLFASPPP